MMEAFYFSFCLVKVKKKIVSVFMQFAAALTHNETPLDVDVDGDVVCCVCGGNSHTPRE
jgi:hypothetical protein